MEVILQLQYNSEGARCNLIYTLNLWDALESYWTVLLIHGNRLLAIWQDSNEVNCKKKIIVGVIYCFILVEMC